MVNERLRYEVKAIRNWVLDNGFAYYAFVALLPVFGLLVGYGIVKLLGIA